MKRTVPALTCLLSLVLTFSAASAGVTPKSPPPPPEPEIPRLRFTMTNLLVGRVNPLGLEDQLRAGLQQKLYDRDSLVVHDNFLFFGTLPKLNPAYLKVGPAVEIQPVTVLNLRVAAELFRWFGSFKFMQSFYSPLADWSDSALSRGGDAGRNYVTTGAHVYIEPTVRLKVGPIALQNRFSAEYWNMNLHNGDRVFYEPTLDTLVPANGWVITNDLDLLYLTNFRFVAGVRYSVVAPQYSSQDLAPGDLVNASTNRQQRIGPLFAYTFFRRGFARFDQPTLVLILNWYVEHRFRTGVDVNQGIPYGVLAFAFTSDFILKR
jgi:hypothetical protein